MEKTEIGEDLKLYCNRFTKQEAPTEFAGAGDRRTHVQTKM